jgi:hypothetical protein
MTRRSYLTNAQLDMYLQRWAATCGPTPPKRGSFLTRRKEFEQEWNQFAAGETLTRRKALSDPIALRVDMAMAALHSALPEAAAELRMRYGLAQVRALYPPAKATKATKLSDIGAGFLIAKIKPYWHGLNTTEVDQQ